MSGWEGQFVTERGPVKVRILSVRQPYVGRTTSAIIF